jgi:hypothetical protein
MATPAIFLRPERDFQPSEGESFSAYEARRTLVAQHRQMTDVVRAHLREFMRLDRGKQLEMMFQANLLQRSRSLKP